MAYILKNTSGLVNTRVTDTGRQKLSQGNFNISYFQIGDSEVSYNTLSQNYNQSNSVVLEPPFNSQNTAGVPQSNKQSVKYPYFVDGNKGNTYGIPFMDSGVDSVFNRAPLRGFFTGNTTASTITWSALTNTQYAITANYIVNMSTLNGTNQIELINLGCDITNNNKPSVGDFITIYYDGNAQYNCICNNLTPTPTPTPTSTPTPTATPNVDPCATPTPTPTPTETPCPTTTSTKTYPSTSNCLMDMYSCYSVLTYRIVAVCENKITLDRPTPDFFTLANNQCMARTIIYPPNMKTIYDSITPRPHWNDDVINFESICDIDQFDVKIWNMNIPWTESPAGLNSTSYEDYTKFGSIDYIGSKEYFGYTSSKGQTDTDYTYYYNSFDEKIIVTPEEQKAIAIIHYTNQTIDFFYGEKFALEPYDPTNPDDTTGEARNFRVHIPWVMWHKNPECCLGQTFWVDPPGFDNKNLFDVHYIQSTKNDNMNQPGLRYYHLWDTNPDSNGIPNRVGKVFPDSKIIIIDDEELIAAMSYKSNRNWTLPAPQVSLITPNTCGTPSSTTTGVLTGNGETMYVTYRLSNSFTFTNSLHCNYYSKLTGNNNDCNPNVSQNVAIRFGDEFKCLSQNKQPTTTTTTTIPTTTTTTTIPPTTTTTTTFVETCFILTEDLNIITTELGDGLIWCNQPILNIPYTIENSNFLTPKQLNNSTTTTTTNCPIFCDLEPGFFATEFQIICQKVQTGNKPDPALWKIIDYTYLIENQKINGYITEESLTGTTFVITDEQYNNASYYDLNNYINLTPVGATEPKLNFGDEYYFYGSIESDIQATIYEMKYKINLSAAEFKNTSNPTWTQGAKSYITEIALLDSNKDIMVISKLQSPILRQGIQQFVVKLDF